ncbi:hypothetical protein KCV07_g528, partial [Aureobasidium melanogenum]
MIVLTSLPSSLAEKSAPSFSEGTPMQDPWYMLSTNSLVPWPSVGTGYNPPLSDLLPITFFDVMGLDVLDGIQTHAVHQCARSNWALILLSPDCINSLGISNTLSDDGENFTLDGGPDSLNISFSMKGKIASKALMLHGIAVPYLRWHHVMSVKNARLGLIIHLAKKVTGFVRGAVACEDAVLRSVFFEVTSLNPRQPHKSLPCRRVTDDDMVLCSDKAGGNSASQDTTSQDDDRTRLIIFRDGPRHYPGVIFILMMWAWHAANPRPPTGVGRNGYNGPSAAAATEAIRSYRL